ncbi:MAG: type transport system ATP-binding protein [Frankiales bacterium]|nr:type transport system ATP-binding protein [Frankiales bacterium]
MTNYALEAKSLRVSRGGATVLHDLTFTLEPSRVVGLVGPSGCGKTTLMRAIAGAQRFSGDLHVLGRPAGEPSLRHDIGYAAQSGAVYQDLTVEENLRYFAGVIGADRDDVGRVMEQVELAVLRDRVVGRLSGGQRTRVSLGVALLGTPQLLLLDEPTVGLDPVLREQLWALFRRLAGGGITLLVSSHVMDEAERCDELLVLRDGTLLAQGSPAALERVTSTRDMNAAFLALIAVAERDAA